MVELANMPYGVCFRGTRGFGQQNLMVLAVLVIMKNMFRGKQLVAPIGQEARRVFKAVGVMAAGPYGKVAHMGASPPG